MNLFILIHLWFQESDREAFCRMKHHLHKYLHRKQTKVTRYNPIPAYQCSQILWLSVTTCFYWIPGYLVDCHKAAEVLFWMCCKPGAWLLLCRHKGQRNWSHSMEEWLHGSLISSTWECQGDPTAQIMLDPSLRALEVQGRGHGQMKTKFIYFYWC